MRFGQRGLSDSVQWAVIAPVVMLLLLGAIQVSVWYSGRTAAQQIAMATAESVALTGADASEAHALAQQMAGRHGLIDLELEVEIGTDEVRVGLNAKVQTILPLVSQVSAEAYRPLEPRR